MRLSAEGVSPSLQLEPEDGMIDMQHVLAKESKTKELKLKNESEFPLQYSIEVCTTGLYHP